MKGITIMLTEIVVTVAGIDYDDNRNPYPCTTVHRFEIEDKDIPSILKLINAYAIEGGKMVNT